MAMYVYNTSGEPIGFVMESFIHTMAGQPVGRIVGSRVHRLDGVYVGEWYKEMVVARPDARPRNLPPVAIPPARVPPGVSYNRRVVLTGGYADAFHLLLAPGAADEPYREAAE